MSFVINWNKKHLPLSHNSRINILSRISFHRVPVMCDIESHNMIRVSNPQPLSWVEPHIPCAIMAYGGLKFCMDSISCQHCKQIPRHVFIINSSSSGQNGHYFADEIFRCNFINEYISIPLKFVPNGPTDIKAALDQVMVRCRIGAIPETILTQFTDAYLHHYRGRWVDPSWPPLLNGVPETRACISNHIRCFL